MVRQLLLTVVVLTALMFASKVTALQCWDCQSDTDTTCCSRAKATTTCDSCAVSSFYRKDQDDADFRFLIMTRGCTSPEYSRYNGSCVEDPDGKSVFRTCEKSCSEDLCNDWLPRLCTD